MTKDEATARSAMKLALEALEAGEYYIDDLEAIVYAADDLGTHEDRAKMQEAITALREALEQERSSDEQSAPVAEPRKQEPVAYGMWDTMLGKGNRMMMVRLDKGQDGCTVPLYTSPQPAQRKPLTGEEIDALREKHSEGRGAGWRFDFKGFARAIEAKLKEKNT